HHSPAARPAATRALAVRKSVWTQNAFSGAAAVHRWPAAGGWHMTTRDSDQKPKRTQVYDLAPISARLVALLLDWLLLGALTGVFMLVGRGWAGLGIGLLLGVGYHWYFLTQQRGQTPGKMVMNIRVIKTDGSALTGTDAAVRCLGYYLNTAFF